MQTAQIFETTIVSTETDHAMRAIVVPKRSIPQGTLETQLDGLGLTKLAPVEPANLARLVGLMLSPAQHERDLTEALVSAAHGSSIQPGVSAQDLRFAEKVCFDRVIPFEQSPLEPESLAKLATSATGAGLGAYVGFVAFGTGPLLFITVPAGMVIFGAAKGIAKALEEGLYERLVTWLRGERAPERKVRAKASEKDPPRDAG